jgi:ABC-type amino acid transport substrate-binding protein
MVLCGKRGQAVKRFVAAGLLAAAAIGPVRAAGEDRPLRVCMDENAPPYSVARGASGSGFDVALAGALAGRLGRPLAIQWFETEFDEDSSPKLELNALLSDGRCDLVAAYPLSVDTLGKPGLKTARLPDFRGAVAADRRRHVDLGVLVPSRPYQRAPLTLLLAPQVGERRVAGIADIADLRIGVVGGTFADAILMLYHKGELINRITHYRRGRDVLLAALEAGEVDAALVALHRFDAYRRAHPDTRLRGTGFHYPLALNLGYVALSENGALLDRVNTALDSMLASGEVAAVAKAAGVTYVAPAEPFVSPGITFKQIEN